MDKSEYQHLSSIHAVCCWDHGTQSTYVGNVAPRVQETFLIHDKCDQIGNDNEWKGALDNLASKIALAQYYENSDNYPIASISFNAIKLFALILLT
jgi:hypothetical protein